MKMQNQNDLWAEKYKAISLKDFKGQEEIVARLKQFIINFRKAKKAAILYGPTGSGKTAIVHALAHDLGFEIIELNASDLRNKDQIESVLSEAALQKSLFAKSKILLVDEIDGISGYYDRGGMQAVINLIFSARFPIFMTANDIWNKKFNKLRQKTELIQLKEIDYKIIANILQNICKKEGICVKDDILKAIAIKTKGDVRAAINDLQTVALEKEIDVSCIYERERNESIFYAMQKIFKAAKIDSQLLGTFDNVNMPIDEIFLWIEENLPYEFQGKELAEAYDALSIADVFRGRIIRQQHWRFLVYENILLTAGIATSKKQARIGFTAYKRPTRILKIWLSNQRNAKKKTIAAKIASATHTSSKRVLKDFYFYRIILKNNNDIIKKLRLSADEREFIALG